MTPDQKIETLEALGGEFERTSGGLQIWKFLSHEAASQAIDDTGAKAWSWCPVQQPKGSPEGRHFVSILL